MNSPTFSNTVGLRAAATLFGLVGAAQVARLCGRTEVKIADRVVPLWPSAVAAAVTGGMSAWLWRMSGSRARNDRR